MSKSSLAKVSAILAGLSIFAFSISPIIAVDSTSSGIAPVENRRILPLKPSGANIVNERRDAIEAKRENIESKIAVMKEKIASRAASLRTRLQEFKNKEKAEIAERVNANLNRVNQNQTEQMKKLLDRMSVILDKLEARVNKAEPDIKDPVAAGTAIAKARAGISTASAAVSAQALNDYTITVTSERRIALDVKAQRNKLHTDLLSVRKLVIDAKQAVAQAIRVAKSGKTVSEFESDSNKEGTNSGQQ